jgi:hypothetical protein
MLLIEGSRGLGENGMSSNGFFVFDLMMVFQKIGSGMKIAKPSKPTSPISLGARIMATSLADLQPASSWTNGTIIQIFAKAKFRSKRMTVA